MKKKKSFRRSYKKKPVIPFYKKRGFWIAVLSVLLFLTLSYFLFFHPIFWINNIHLSGNEEVDREMIVDIIENEIVSDIFFLRSRTIFLVRTSEMADKIANEFPQIEFVQVKRSFPDSLTVTVRERKPVAIWCRDDGDDCYLIDRNGVIFKETSIPTGLAVIRGGDTAVSLSEVPISPENTAFLMEAWRGIKDIVKIVEFRIEESKIIAQTAEGWDIYFTFKKPASVQTKKLLLVIEEQIFNEDRAGLEYVDVRFEDRVYFKHKDR